MNFIKKDRANFIIILGFVLFFYLPIFANPNSLLGRGNDLQEFFWPIFYFVKGAVLENHTLPLWNNLFFSGTPLLSDPQAPLFYLPNVIFLLLPIDTAFIVSFFLHTLIGGIGVYLFARLGLYISPEASLFSAILYATTPKLAGYLEAGHVGLVYSLAWIPFVLLATIKLVRSPKLGWSLLLATSLAGIFYTHLLTFLITLAAALFLGIYLLLDSQKRTCIKSISLALLGGPLTFGLVAIALLPQIDWLPNTTRFLLLEGRDVYPKWVSFGEFATSALAPWWQDKNNIWQLDTEKWIALGFLPTVLAGIGFFSAKRKVKLAIFGLVVAVLLISLNNISPAHSFLLSQDWYVLARVATRVWFIPVTLVALLAGLGIEAVRQAKAKRVLVFILALATIAELVTISWIRLAKPIEDNLKLAPEGVYEFLKEDPEIFRVFCVNRCLSQKKAAEYNLQLVEGYGTLQQKNYYNHFIQLSQVYWDKYTLTLPPFEIYNFREIQPYSPELADYNVKYVISPYELRGANLIQETQIDNYLIYRNTINKSRAYFSTGEQAQILEYSPNKIRVDTTTRATDELILSEVYNSGWKAYLNGKKLVPIEETKGALRQVKIEKDTDFVEFVYEPESYNIGKAITLASLFAVIIVLTGYTRKRFR